MTRSAAQGRTAPGGKVSPLFRKIEELQGDTAWGHVLDAGTGPKSLAWVASLDTQAWCAVTAQQTMADSARSALPAPPREQDRIVLGNWVDETFLAEEHFDTVLLDYLVGSVDAFAPYFQETLIHRLAARTRGVLYLTGTEPYVPIVADDEVGAFVGDLGRLRDACMLLGRGRPYREYPSFWAAAKLVEAGFTVTKEVFFPIRHRRRFLASQLEICDLNVRRFADPALAASMREHVERMRRRGEALIERHDGLPYGRDYVLRAVQGS